MVVDAERQQGARHVSLDMGVGVDEAWNDELARKVDDGGALGKLEVSDLPHAEDFIVVQNDYGIGQRRRASAVDQCRALEDCECGAGRRLY